MVNVIVVVVSHLRQDIMGGNPGNESADNRGNIARKLKLDIVPVNGTAGSSMQQPLPRVEPQVERPTVYTTPKAAGDVAVMIIQYKIFANDLASQSTRK